MGLNYEKIKELFGFGKWVLGSSVLLFFVIHGDDVFVGKFLGVTMLGFYQVAYRISNMPATEITHIISQVTFPVYSKLQDNIPKLREAYLRVLQVTTFLSFPIAGLIFVLAFDITKIFLGEKWIPIVPSMQALAFWGALRSIGSATGVVFTSIGKPKILTKIQLGHLILLSILIYPFSKHWGIFGTSLAIVFASLIPIVCTFYIVLKLVQCKIQIFCKIVVLPVINTAIMISVIVIPKTYWCDTTRIFNIFLFVLFGAASYLGLTLLFDKYFDYKMQNIIKNNLSGLIHRANV